MKKKGFTLIEMLGGIVVLAMITLIAVPVTIGIIEKARKSSLEDSGYGLVEAATLYYAEHQMGKVARFDIENNKIETKEEYPLRYKGSIQSGTVLINQKGEITICINDGGYAAYKNYQDTKVTIVDKKTCTVPENSSIVYLDGEATENSNNDLLKRIESLEQQNKNLQQQINNMNTSGNIANLTNQHNSDMNIIWNKVGREDLSSIGNGSISKILIDQKGQISNLQALMNGKVDTTVTNNLSSQISILKTTFKNDIEQLNTKLSLSNDNVVTVQFGTYFFGTTLYYSNSIYIPTEFIISHAYIEGSLEDIKDSFTFRRNGNYVQFSSSNASVGGKMVSLVLNTK